MDIDNSRPERRTIICDGINKTCVGCGQSKPLIEFNKSSRHWTKHTNNCKSCTKEKSQKRYSEKHQHIKKVAQEWNVKNKDKRRGYRKKHQPFESKLKRIKRNCSVQIAKYLHAKFPSKKIHKLTSCTTAVLKSHIESQFAPDMDWENWGTVWQIDHIIPLSLFNVLDEKEKIAGNHYTNLRPLYKKINGLMTAEQKAMYLKANPRVTDKI